MSQHSDTFLKLVNTAASSGRLRRLVFSKGGTQGAQKLTGRVCLFHGASVLSTEAAFADGKVLHARTALPLTPENFSAMLASFRQVNLLTEDGDAEYKRSVGGRDVLLAPAGLLSALSGAGVALPAEELDRKKEHILTHGIRKKTR